MRAAVVGAGRMGCAIALGLKSKGHEISGVCSRSKDSASYLCDMLGIASGSDLARTVGNSDLVFITVPDDAIEAVSLEIGRTAAKEAISGKTFLHCSGALTSEALVHVADMGAKTGSLHPIQTFADRENGWKGLDGIYFGFEGSDGAEAVARRVVEAFNGSMIRVEREGKPLYHAAACTLSNYLVVLADMAEGLLESAGADYAGGIEAFMPLIQKTLDNLARLGSKKALTGPVSRGDFSTVEGHIEAIGHKCPGYEEIYRLLGYHALLIAQKRGGLSAQSLDRLKTILGRGI